MNSVIRFVGEEMRDSIDSLRMSEYAAAKGFSVDLKTLKWRQSDAESYIIVAETENRFASTMRGEAIDNQALLEAKLECPWDFPVELEYPVLLLSRAATNSSIQKRGLNLLLRYHFLKLARSVGIRHVVGTFVAGSPREKTLREMGYQFFENKLGWQKSTYKSLAPVQVVVLDLKAKGAQALSYCEDRVGAEISEFKLLRDYPELRLVRSI